MRKLLPIIFSLFFFCQDGTAQQDPMYTQYMFNTLSYNPGYAGSKGYMSIIALYRNQWWSIDGAPETQVITAHTPIKERVGVGISITNDKLGASGSTVGNLSYAYQIPFGKGKVSLGLQAGFMNYRADFTQLKYKDPRLLDGSFAKGNANLWLPNFGAGIFYFTDRFYFGASVPRLLKSDLQKEHLTTNQWAKLYRHYYFTAGVALPLGGDAIVFKPSVLIKSVGLFEEFASSSKNLQGVGAPNEFDIDASFLFYQAFWVGASFRSSFEAIIGGTSSVDSGDIWAAFYARNGMRIGLAYDFTLTELQGYAKGSLEVMVGYDFAYSNRRIVTPRYF